MNNNSAPQRKRGIMMADEKRNQDKPEYLNEQEQDFLKNDINGGSTIGSTPTGLALPRENNVDYNQVSGMDTGSQAQLSRDSEWDWGGTTSMQSVDSYDSTGSTQLTGASNTTGAYESTGSTQFTGASDTTGAYESIGSSQITGASESSDVKLLPEPHYREETAAEIAAPVSLTRGRGQSEGTEEQETKASGNIMGISALAISILSLFVLPVILGITGIVLGFVARNRSGSKGLANWAIGIGAISIIIGMFVLPFY